jgi:hypothetical protein
MFRERLSMSLGTGLMKELLHGFLCKSYSRKLCNHRYAIALFAAAYNFCKVHNTLGCTPAVGIKLTSETWTIERLIEEATKSTN